MSLQHFVLAQYEEEHSPPSKEVLDITVISDLVFIDVAKWEETGDSKTLKRVSPSITVRADDLYDALNTCSRSDQRVRIRVQERKKNDKKRSKKNI